jgi:hypothetical protein
MTLTNNAAADLQGHHHPDPGGKVVAPSGCILGGVDLPGQGLEVTQEIA